MQISIALIKKLEGLEPQLKDVLFAILEEIERQREETVTKREFNELKEIVAELAEAQKRTEQRVNELAEAQKRTEEELQKLVQEHRKTREQVGGLSNTVGYILENEAMKALPVLLEKEFGLKLKERLIRKFIQDNRGRQIEVNIIGQATKDGKQVVIIGEAKAQLSKNKVNEFLRKKLQRLEGVFKEEIFPILVTHMVTQPDVEEYACKKGIKRVYYSYEF